MSIHPFKKKSSGSNSGSDGVAPGGPPPYDSDMEKRVEKLETAVGEIKTDLAVLKATCATAADIHKLGQAIQGDINTQTWKLVTFVCGFGTALVAATYFIVKHVT